MAERRDQSHGWCSLRLRFDQRELALLRASERVRGAALAHQARPNVLREAINLAKLGSKLTRTTPGANLTLEEPDVNMLVEAVRFAIGEVQWAAGMRDAEDSPRRQAVLDGFSELSEQGMWRSFGVIRDLEALADRLRQALTASTHRA
jgi:hypothetical protein